MNTLRRTLFISLTLQICLAATIFGAAEEAALAFLTVPLALGTLLVIDLWGWVRPNPLVLNFAALAALGFSFAEFRHEGESRLLAGGHLIIYLTWTFLLQQKDLRRMWWIFALSVLQVAMGAVLTVQPWFGAALFVYTASAVWTMSLLSLTRAALLSERQLLSAGVALPQDEPLHEVRSRRSFATNGVRADEMGRWISPRFLGGGVVTFAFTLVVGLTFFVLTPRVWIGSLNVLGGDSPFRRQEARTGFDESVKLGDIGQIQESNELIMTVEVLERTTGEPIPPERIAEAVGDEPLFRGAVLDIYADGNWVKGSYRTGQASFSGTPGPILLHITRQPINSPILFYTGTQIFAQGITPPQEVIYHPFTFTLESAGSSLDSPYSYVVATNPPDVIHDQAERLWIRDATRLNGLSRPLNRLLETRTTRLTALARQVLEESTEDGDSDSEATARVLESYLRDSGKFSYTLDLSVDDPQIDPVEDFVFNRKKGHCEYFASALALMLRGVGIPSRVIRGFKGAEYNAETGLLEVRALHSHAWVEAFVDGGWIPMDATPGARDDEVSLKAKDANSALADQTRSFWFQGMNYSKSQQEELVYAPLRKFGTVMRQNFEGLMQGELPLLSQLNSLGATPSVWFSGTGFVVAAVLLLLVAGLVWLLRKAGIRWKGWRRGRDLAVRRTITIEFFARLMKLLQKSGLPDIQTLTPREFAERAENQFQTPFQQSGISGITHTLVDLFYSVRFGNQPLTTEQLHVVEEKLGMLERCLTAPKGALAKSARTV